MVPSRRRLLKYAGGAVALGAGGQMTRCVSAEITSVTHRIAEEFPYNEFLIVTVDVKSSVAPVLRASVTTCDGTETRTKKLTTGQSEYTFGPFGHHCLKDYTVRLDGCP